MAHVEQFSASRPTVWQPDKLEHERVQAEGSWPSMTSQPESIERVLALLDGLEDVTHRAMMGEYILYYRGKVVGGIYDDRFLIKITPASQRLLPDAARATPYEGAKEMLLVEVEDREILRDVLDAMWEDLPAPKRKK